MWYVHIYFYYSTASLYINSSLLITLWKSKTNSVVVLQFLVPNAQWNQLLNGLVDSCASCCWESCETAFTINTVSVVSDCNVCWSRNRASAGVNGTDHHYLIGDMVQVMHPCMHGIIAQMSTQNNTTVLHDCTIYNYISLLPYRHCTPDYLYIVWSSAGWSNCHDITVYSNCVAERCTWLQTKPSFADRSCRLKPVPHYTSSAPSVWLSWKKPLLQTLAVACPLHGDGRRGGSAKSHALGSTSYWWTNNFVFQSERRLREDVQKDILTIWSTRLWGWKRKAYIHPHINCKSRWKISWKQWLLLTRR